MNLQSFLEKLNSRKLFALLVFIVLELVDKETAQQVAPMFITYILAQGAVDAAATINSKE
jgi:hypothetical protein